MKIRPFYVKATGIMLASMITGGSFSACSKEANHGQMAEEPTQPAVSITKEKVDSSMVRGNTNPSAEEIALVNSTLDDSYLGDLFDVTIPGDYSAYPWKDDVTLEVWMNNNLILSSVCSNLNDHVVLNKIQEYTGINLKMITPALGEESTEFSLMIASGDLPDIIIDANQYKGGPAAGVADGAYLDLTDTIDEYMPNYSFWRTSDEERRKVSVTDSGIIGAVHGLAPYNEWMWFGLLIKQEALDKTGLPVPETIDELHDFLAACKKAGYKEPLNYGSVYGQVFTGVLNSAYGVHDWLFLDESGNVAWGPAQEGAKDYLAMMSQWYNEGLLNRDWPTADFDQRMAEAVSDDCAVMIDSPDTMWGYWKENNDIDFVAAMNPVLNKGDKPVVTYRNFKGAGWNCAVTATTEHPEAAMAFLDFAYTKKGWELYNFGEYGTVHLVDENGKPYFHKDSLMYNDPDNQPLSNLIWKYRLHDFPGIRDDHNSNPLLTAEGSYSGDIRREWTENMDGSVTMPPVALTPEEASKEGQLGTNLSTLRNEYFAKIIMGQLPVDAYDDFMKEAKGTGMDEFLSIWQAALERYNQR